MDNKEWSLTLLTNPGIIGWDLNSHIQFKNGDSYGDTYIPILTSPHVNVLSKNESTRAHTRLTTLLRLVNGLRILQNTNPVEADTTLYFENRSARYSEDFDITLEELSYPFDESVIARLEKRDKNSNPDQYKDYFQLIIDEPIVREVIILLTLAQEQLIYLVINAYKIFEIINHDLGLSTKNYKNTDNLPAELFSSLLQFKSYGQYMNSRDGAGYLSRHGSAKTAPAPAKIPTREEFKTDLNSIIHEWLNYKCTQTFGRSYSRQVSTSDTFDI